MERILFNFSIQNIMKSTILFAIFIAAVSVKCDPIRVQGNTIGDIVTVTLNFNGVFSTVVDEEIVNTNVGLKSKGAVPALDANSEENLPEPSANQDAILAAEREAVPTAQIDAQNQPSVGDTQVEEQIQKAIEHLLRNLQK